MANELRHCVNTLGCKAAHLVSYTLDRQMDDPAFFPFYETAQELDIPLFCHPSTLGAPGTLINRQTHFFPMHILGRPLNCVAPLVAMVLGGVFEKFPRLKVVFFEVTAEFLVYWMHRMTTTTRSSKRPVCVRTLSMLPSEYVKRNCSSLRSRCEVATAGVGGVGETHVVVATTTRTSTRRSRKTVSGIRERPDLSPKQKKLIREDNALNLLRL